MAQHQQLIKWLPMIMHGKQVITTIWPIWLFLFAFIYICNGGKFNLNLFTTSMGFIYILADSRQWFKISVIAARSGLEKNARHLSVCNSFLAYSFLAPQVVRSGEAKEQLYIFLFYPTEPYGVVYRNFHPAWWLLQEQSRELFWPQVPCILSLCCLIANSASKHRVNNYCTL